jgi:hypothetical protein
MQNIDNLIQNVYDETGELAELKVKFDPLAGEWVCRVQENGYDWLDDAGERYLVIRDFDLQTAMSKLNQLCARQTAASIL